MKIYDCYRPQRAVNDFIAWSQDATDLKMKKSYYPNINKADFFKLGYVAAKSSHTRGSTVDLTIVQLGSHHKLTEINRGTRFDYLDEQSHPLNANLNDKIRANRLFLRAIMQQAGFEPCDTEWWHFTLKDEPFSDTYFDFPVK